MIYTISDLHGDFDKFLKMLDLINFSEDDTLYILGDVIDRGNNSLKIIDFIRGKKNITLLLGNHEMLYMIAYTNEEYINAWTANGGLSTSQELNNKDDKYKQELFEYFTKLPTFKIIDKFILVHAGLFIPDNAENLTIEELMEMQNHDSLLWSRYFITHDEQFKDFTAICGHTPTVRFLDENQKSKILYAPGKIMIDCGIHHKPNGRLGCLRLDDLEEFYID